MRILFLCTGNSCRSQMAEGWARQLKGETIEAFSAGIAARGLDPRAVKVMAEAGVDISRQRSKTLDEVKDTEFDYVVTLCDHAHESCPIFPGGTKVVHVGFDDPPRLAQDATTDEEALAHYRRVRDEIRVFVERLPEGLTGAAPAARTRVLFLCTGNSCRSQMAEAFLRKHGGDRFEAHSAGLEPQPIHPLTLRVMEEAGLDLRGRRSKSVREYLGKMTFGYLITVCEQADRNCPSTFPGVSARLFWPFEDPARTAGSETQKLEKFRQVRDQIEERIKAWMQQPQ